MKNDKNHLRKKFLLSREKNYFKKKNFDFNLLFSLIKKHFNIKSRIVVAGYYPSNYEVNILNFLKKCSEKRLTIVLPVVKNSKLMNFKKWIFEEPLYVSKFGILEPKNLNKEILPDVIIVPLVAFDAKLNRIGYGGGYYDRSLKKIKKLKKKIVTIGASYTFQQCKNIPVHKHDFKLDYIFTERGIISANK